MKEFSRPFFLAEYLRSDLEKQLEAYQQSVANGEAADKRKSFTSCIVELERKLINLKEPCQQFTEYFRN
jgi:hypothetical protein